MADTLVMTFETATSDSAYEIGLLLLKSLHDVLSGPRHGRYYPVPGNAAYDRNTPKDLRAKNYYVKFTGTTNRSEIRGAAYRASAPGEPPASRTGRLRQSFNMMVMQQKINSYIVKIRTNVIYADDLEYGTESMSPRPFMITALNNAMPKINKILTKVSIRILRRAMV